MPYSIDIPGFGTNEKNIKDLIVNTLVVEWPLSLKKIHHILKKRYKVSVSYQAIHKALKELSEKRIILKNKLEYSLNPEWIKNLKEFSTNLEEMYAENNSLIGKKLKEGENMQSFTFDSLANLDRFLMHQVEKFLTNDKFKDLPCYSYWKFEWWPLFISRAEYKILTKILNPARVHLAVNDNSAIAKFCANFYEKVGIKSKINIDLENEFDFVIIDDLVIQIYTPKKLINKISSAFDKIDNLDQMDMGEINKLFEEENEINVILMKNRTVANILSERVANYFKK
ncbi:hypothetical protein GOV14_01630 [Candidatus Pacearchaeota archaeon]|nr:hypothetical protein [Candidatus Pacearchaeota archaeon]